MDTVLAKDTPRPPAPSVPETIVDFPIPDHTDPADLFAWYGERGVGENFRKITLSLCSESIRAQHAGVKISEDRIDDLAHLHPAYLAFMVRTLDGKRAYQAEAFKRGFGS
jgi:hypothetical protein